MSSIHPTARVFAGALGLALGAGGLGSCSSHKVELEPIHLTIDINLRIQRELEEFFDFEEALGLPEEEATASGEGGS